jgi:hypothetical protein
MKKFLIAVSLMLAISALTVACTNTSTKPPMPRQLDKFVATVKGEPMPTPEPIGSAKPAASAESTPAATESATPSESVAPTASPTATPTQTPAATPVG